MALITTNASPIRQYNAFTGLSAEQRSQSGIARAEIVYYGADDWDAAGATDERLFQIPQTSLPKDFGYVLTDAYMTIKTDTDSGRIRAEASALMRIFPGGTLGPQIPLNLHSKGGRQDAAGLTAIGNIPADSYNASYPSVYGARSVMQYELDSKPSALIYPFGSGSYTSTPNPASTFDLAVGEQYRNGGDYTVHYYIRFLQYDIDQSYNYVVQSPQLTR
jgi:hypothetical protein